MAGDLGFDEAVLLAGAIPPGSANLPVLQEFGSLRLAMGASPALAPLAATALDETARLGLDAFRLRQSDSYRQGKQRRVAQGMSWGGGQGVTSQTEPSAGPASVEAREEAGGDPAEAPSRAPGFRLSGRIAVGTVMVSGTAPSLSLSMAEQTKIVGEIQNGLSYLASQSPARDVTFVHDTQVVTVAAQDNPGGGSFEACERPWRDAALAALGLPAGPQGVQQHVRRITQELKARYGYCAFFTKYGVYHFAYAQTGSVPYLVMNYFNDGWGTENLDRVFAHETCHIFGAPDEYAAAGCTCGGRFGVFGVANINCESCAEGGGVECLMKANTWAMCQATPYHVGYEGLPAFSPPAPSV